MATEYPRTTDDGRTVWACCESAIGRPCAHERHMTYSVTGSSADEYLCIRAGMLEEDACDLARRESTSGRWGVVMVKRAATGETTATYAHGDRRD